MTESSQLIEKNKAITVKKIRDLVIEPAEKGRPSYVYAASGLVILGQTLYIVADDEMQLASFELGNNKSGTWIPLLPGSLPLNYEERKAKKPDLEAITFIRPYEYSENGAMLIVPSFSRTLRMTGALVAVNSQSKLSSEVIPVDFSVLGKSLVQSIDGLNVEGIAISENYVKMFHRGSRKKGKSAVIELDRKMFLKDLHDTHQPSAECIKKITRYELGEIEGTRFEFTDAQALSDERVAFLCTAEAADDEYVDGASLGSCVGIMSGAGELQMIVPISGHEKFEGISAKYISDKRKELSIILVADTDDQSRPSAVFEGVLAI
jgi:hypothetical protein